MCGPSASQAGFMVKEHHLAGEDLSYDYVNISGLT